MTLITKNPADFLALHQIDSMHAGIFAIYQDNDKTRDMRDADIVETELTIASFFAHPTIESFTLVLTGEMLVESGLSTEEVESIVGEAATPVPVIERPRAESLAPASDS